MRGALRHARVRLAAVARSPYAAVVVVISGLATLALSPTLPLVGVDADETIDRIAIPLITAQWLWLWPALITRAVMGRTTGSLWSAVEPPLPQLPVGPRARMLAEVAVVCSLLALVRAVGFAAQPLAVHLPGLPTPGAGDYVAAFGAHWLRDVLAFAPVIAAWTFPTRSSSMVMLRPLIAALAVYAAVVSGLYEGLATAAGVSAALVAVMVAPWGRDAEGARRMLRSLSPAGAPHRLPRDGQFVRDLLWQPLARNRAVVLVAIGGQAALLVGEAAGVWPPMIFHVGSSLALGLLLAQVVLRPLGSPMLMASISGLGKHRLGDFAAAWSVLPVPRHTVLRGVYLHGLVGGLVLWALMVGVFYARAWLEMGGVAFSDPDVARTAALLLPAASAAPMLAGLLVSLAAGSRRFAAFVGVLLVGYLPLQIVVERLELVAGPLAGFALAAALGIAAGLPPMAHLRRA